MSATRDRRNLQGMLSMLGGKPPPPELEQPLRPAALAGSGDSLFPVDVEISAASLTVGGAYYLGGSGWAALGTSIDVRAQWGVVVRSDGSSSRVRLAGIIERSGTAGNILYAVAGALTATYPGDETDETTSAPWVWEVGWQVDADHALILPACPYRPRLVRFCVDGGETALTVTVREYPADP
jgi:hypothetical protein